MTAVLLTGGGGFVGSNLAEVFGRHGATVVAPSHAELDLADRDAVARAVAVGSADAVVHAAIWNDPAGLRDDPRRAWSQYVEVTRNVVDAGNGAGVPVVLVSTDWVFGGGAGAPYAEDDPPSPVNAYGFLKAACELVVAERARDGLVARIAGVQGVHRARPGSPAGPRSQDAGFGYFVASLVAALRAGEPFEVWTGPGVNARATPTLASDAGELIWRALSIGVASMPPVLHCCGGESIDRLELARRAAVAFELDPALVREVPAPGPSAGAAAEAVPVDTRLDARATAAALGVTLRSLDETLHALRSQLDGVAVSV